MSCILESKCTLVIFPGKFKSTQAENVHGLEIDKSRLKCKLNVSEPQFPHLKGGIIVLA